MNFDILDVKQLKLLKFCPAHFSKVSIKIESLLKESNANDIMFWIIGECKSRVYIDPRIYKINALPLSEKLLFGFENDSDCVYFAMKYSS